VFLRIGYAVGDGNGQGLSVGIVLQCHRPGTVRPGWNGQQGKRRKNKKKTNDIRHMKD